MAKHGDTGLNRLIFGEGLMAPSLDGSKLFTVRKYREGSHDFKKSEVIVGEFKDGLNILLSIVEDTKIAPFKKLKSPKRNLHKAGYYFDDAYFKDLATYYPDLTWDTLGAIISFEILKVNGVPVVAVNEHAQ